MQTVDGGGMLTVKRRSGEDQLTPVSPPSPNEPFEVASPTGVVTLRGTLAGGKLEGETVAYNESGHLVQRACYLAGVLHGPMQVYENGMLQMETLYAGGKMNGPQVIYDDQGRLIANIPHVAGQPHGMGEVFSIPADAWSGSLLTPWASSRGESIDFAENGHPQESRSYRAGKLEGDVVT